VLLPEQASQHVSRVLRLRDGAELTVFDGRGGEYRATLRLSGRGGAAVDILERIDIERESPLSITLLQGLARGERMDWVIQKSTELGVTTIVPVATSRSVVQLDAGRGDKRLQHWQGVAASACEQCGRNVLPHIEAPQSFESALALAVSIPLRIVLDPEDGVTLASVLPPDTGAIALLVGPEGGLDTDELALARQAGFRSVRLGPRVLRTETAGLAALAALQCLAGDYA